LFINHGLHGLHGFFNHEAHEEHEEKLDRITGLTEIMFLPAWCSWQNLLLKPALSQVIAFVHKVIKMTFSRSWLKTVIVSRKDAQNAQKSAKNDQKSAL